MRKRGTQRIMSWLLAFVMMWQLSGLWELRVHAEDGTEMSVEERLEEEAASPAIDCEETGRREESVKHFRLEDGSYLAVSYGVPVHYRENGEWMNIDNTLQKTVVSYAVMQERADGSVETEAVEESAWVNTANDFRVSFPERLNQNSRIGVYHMFSNHFLNLWENPSLVQQL